MDIPVWVAWTSAGFLLLTLLTLPRPLRKCRHANPEVAAKARRDTVQTIANTLITAAIPLVVLLHLPTGWYTLSGLGTLLNIGVEITDRRARRRAHHTPA
ncbi:hypothetical protein ACN20G_37225 (plasmid) [Streptomyces sp. BI20]|uniref:hypothetical protein n=1 Tax=Streptomyces sp. BI20 TaxID=3403460 RepID=UPI003C754D50